MGWLYTKRRDGQSVIDFLREELAGESDTSKLEIIAGAANLREAYLAARLTDKSKSKSITFAIVCLIEHRPNDKDGMTFGYKDMSEDMGPYAARCPMKILKMLSPLDQIYEPGTSSYEYAERWRQKCLKYSEVRKAARGVRPGDTIRFKEPIKFVDGHQASLFTVTKHEREKQSLFVSPDNGRAYRIADWRSRELVIELP